MSWSALALAAGPFVLVDTLIATRVIAELGRILTHAAGHVPVATSWISGGLISVVSNRTDNLPAGLVASSTIQLAHPPQMVVDALLIGVGIGLNLSVSDSLATILWLTAIRREDQEVSFWRFLILGAVVMPPALLLALAGRVVHA